MKVPYPSCNTVAEPTVNTGFPFLFANVAVSKSRHRFSFIQIKERVKRTEKYLFVNFLSKGGRLWKGKVFAHFPSVLIYVLLDA